MDSPTCIRLAAYVMLMSSHGFICVGMDLCSSHVFMLSSNKFVLVIILLKAKILLKMNKTFLLLSLYVLLGRGVVIMAFHEKLLRIHYSMSEQY